MVAASAAPTPPPFLTRAQLGASKTNKVTPLPPTPRQESPEPAAGPVQQRDTAAVGAGDSTDAGTQRVASQVPTQLWGPEPNLPAAVTAAAPPLVDGPSVAPRASVETMPPRPLPVVARPPVARRSSPAATAAPSSAAARVPYTQLPTDTLRLMNGNRRQMVGRVTLRTFFPEAAETVIARKCGSVMVNVHRLLEDGVTLSAAYKVLVSYAASKSGTDMRLLGVTSLVADMGLEPGSYVRLAWGPEVAGAPGKRVVTVERTEVP
ncbi:hypothetical protein HXX76_006219 [Chlamydomonas incerta]|uniref:Uncharacterized protein n=1 Tax=Chlamydomonas incerta TaxID=51695 RepID=A0A835W5R9_CHLIN|nr:hypothetical protein HXX76_006219 [Chlamydomonas incerta]|eukprot:KAG2436691.1 hypothetical protein HXX76_006219 [Chlamydomonas incerta]